MGVTGNFAELRGPCSGRDLKCKLASHKHHKKLAFPSKKWKNPKHDERLSGSVGERNTTGHSTNLSCDFKMALRMARIFFFQH